MKLEVILILLIVLPICFSGDFHDFDQDGMSDEWEVRNGLRFDVVDDNKDPDNDGLSNLQEFNIGSDPHSIDSDGDEVSDYKEFERGTDPLSKDRVVWPLIVVPILIILGVFVLFLFEKYHLDLWVIEKWKEYNSKPVVKKKIVTVQKPKIQFKNLSEIYRQREEKKKQKEIALGALSVFHGNKSKEAEYYKKKIANNKENEIPKQLEGLMSKIDSNKSLADLRKTFDVKKSKKDVFDKLKRMK